MIAWGLDGARSSTASFEYPLDRVLAQLGDPGRPAISAAPSRVEIKKVPAVPAVMIRW